MKAEFIHKVESDQNFILIDKNVFKATKKNWKELQPKIRNLAKIEAVTSITLKALIEKHSQEIPDSEG